MDKVALADALARGTLAGAGLDVYEQEPRVDARLHELENIVLLPHLDSATLETRSEMDFRVIANIDAYLAGMESTDRVDCRQDLWRRRFLYKQLCRQNKESSRGWRANPFGCGPLRLTGYRQVYYSD